MLSVCPAVGRAHWSSYAVHLAEFGLWSSQVGHCLSSTPHGGSRWMRYASVWVTTLSGSYFSMVVQCIAFTKQISFWCLWSSHPAIKWYIYIGLLYIICCSWDKPIYYTVYIQKPHWVSAFVQQHQLVFTFIRLSVINLGPCGQMVDEAL